MRRFLFLAGTGAQQGIMALAARGQLPLAGYLNQEAAQDMSPFIASARLFRCWLHRRAHPAVEDAIICRSFVGLWF